MPVLEVFADVCCPFTHVGLLRFVAERDLRGRSDVVLRVRAWPLELVNGAPLDADLVGDEVDELRSQVAPELFSGFDRRSFPSTSMPAMALAAAAHRIDESAGERVSLALRRALFEEGRNISDPTVLDQIEGDAGLPFSLRSDDADVRADWDEGRRRGVIGSPHFFIGSDGFFCPSLDISRDAAGRLQITSDPAELAQFFDRCFSHNRGAVGDDPSGQ